MRNYDFTHIENIINSFENKEEVFDEFNYEIHKESEAEYIVTLFEASCTSIEWMKMDVRPYAVVAYRDWNSYPWEPLDVDAAAMFEACGDLFHGVDVRVYLEASERGLMALHIVNDWFEASEVVFNYLVDGYYVTAEDDEWFYKYAPYMMDENTSELEDVVVEKIRKGWKDAERFEESKRKENEA